MPFVGSTAIVTGGASGIGLAISERLARDGAKGAIFDVDLEAHHRVVRRQRVLVGQQVRDGHSSLYLLSPSGQSVRMSSSVAWRSSRMSRATPVATAATLIRPSTN